MSRRRYQQSPAENAAAAAAPIVSTALLRTKLYQKMRYDTIKMTMIVKFSFE